MTSDDPTPWASNLLTPLHDARCFRIMQIGHLLQLLRSGALYMPSIHRWDDPYENVLRHAIKFTNRGVATFRRLTHGMCALCLSRPPECVAMWRLYGKPAVTDPKSDELSVRVEFRVDALLDQLWRHIGDDYARIMVWGGTLNYLDEPTLRQQILDLVDATDGTPGVALLDASNRQIVQTLFLKRRAFAFEREVRIIVDPRFPQADLQGDGEEVSGLRIPLGDEAAVISSVTACPWITYRDEKVLRQRLENAGWTGQFDRSTIYDHPIAIGASGDWLG